MSYITAIGTANPAHRFQQSAIADFMLSTMKLNDADRRKLRAIFKASGIETRHSVLSDYGKTGSFDFFSKVADADIFPSTTDRLAVFRKEAVELSVNAIEKMFASWQGVERSEISHLIVVSCTGMYAPGLDIDIVKRMNLPSTVQRTAITFMGCYAAFNALKVADAICRSEENAKVLIVCTELCSLHFQASGTDDNVLANALFADGAAAVLVERSTNSPLRLKLESFHSDLALAGEDDMAWEIGDLGFEMKLSAYVPDIIRQGIGTLTKSLLRKIESTIEDVRHFAIHPGGKKILEAIEHELGISKAQNRHAYEVLRKFGNMSSPTVLFVLQELITSLSPADKAGRILSFAFGPGLTMESMVLDIEQTSHA